MGSNKSTLKKVAEVFTITSSGLALGMKVGKNFGKRKGILGVGFAVFALLTYILLEKKEQTEA